MAYYLQFDGIDDYVTAPSWTPTSADNWSFRIELTTPTDITSDQFITGHEVGTGDRSWKLYINGGNLGILHESSWQLTGLIEAPITANTRYIVEGTFNDTEIKLLFDGAQVNIAGDRNLAVVNGVSHFSRIGLNQSGGGQVGGIQLHSLQLFDSGDFTSEARFYDPSASSGTGSTLPETTSLQDGTLVNFPTDNSQWVTTTTPTTRKSSAFDIETTLGTITTATLNSVNVFDHVTGQVGTTVSFAGAATDEITTSGEYPLVLGDGVGTETIAVQVNVVGVAPSNNPVQKDGAALASLTGVQLRVTSGANINGTELFYSGTATTDASGNLSNIDLSSTAAAAADPVLLHMRTSAGDSIIVSETVGLI